MPSLLAPSPSIVYNRGIGYLHGTSRDSLQGTIGAHSHPAGPGSAKSCCPCRRGRAPLPAASAREIRAAIKGAARRGCGSAGRAERLLSSDRLCAPSECAGPWGCWGLYAVFWVIFNFHFIFMCFLLLFWVGFLFAFPSPSAQMRA